MHGTELQHGNALDIMNDIFRKKSCSLYIRNNFVFRPKDM